MARQSPPGASPGSLTEIEPSAAARRALETAWELAMALDAPLVVTSLLSRSRSDAGRPQPLAASFHRRPRAIKLVLHPAAP
jgi:hypothetical protein